MNKYIKLTFIALLGLMPLMLSSCSDDDERSVELATGAQVYFPMDVLNVVTNPKINLSKDETSYEIPIMRSVATDAITVPLTVSNANGIISVASSVSFAAGQNKSSVTVNYDFDTLGYDNYQTITITIDPDYTTPYGNNIYTASLGVPSPYTPIGDGLFYDGFILGGYNVLKRVTVEQRDDMPNMYRITFPYSDEILEYCEWTGYISGVTQDYIEFTVHEDGTVSWDDHWNTNCLYDGDLIAYHASHYGYDDPWSVVGYNEDGSIQYFELYPYFADNNGWWSPYNPVIIAFPGYDMAEDWGYDIFDDF